MRTDGQNPRNRTYKLKDVQITKQQIYSVDAFLQLCFIHRLRKNFLLLIMEEMQRRNHPQFTSQDYEDLKLLWLMLEALSGNE